MHVQEKNRLEHVREQFVQRSLSTMIQTIQKQIDMFDDEMHEAIDKSTHLRRASEIIQSVPGFGETSASQIVADLPELGSMNRRQITKFFGG